MITSAQIAQQHNAFNMGLGINPGAYQNQMFGGVTPFGQGFGNTIGIGGMSGFKSAVDTGLMAGMGASLGNMAMGKAGLGASSTLSGIAKYGLGNVSMGMHLGPIAAAQAAMGQMVKGAEQGQAVQQQMNRFAGNRINMGGGMGTGVSRKAALDMTESLRTMSDIPEMFTSMGELTKIMSKINDMNILQGARDAGDFKKKFTGMVKALRDMSKDLGSTMEEALPFLQSSVSQGFLNQTEQVRNVRLLQASSGVGIGVGRGTINQMQQFGADTLRSMGGDSRFGASGMRQISNQLSIAQQKGIMSQDDITRITGKVGEEGNQAASQMLFGAQTQFMQNSGAGRMLTAGLAERGEDGNFTGRLDREKLRQFKSGSLSMDDINSLGRDAMTGENAASFENAMARGMGAEAGSQVGTTGIASAINQILSDKGITSTQAQRRMVSKMTGLRQDMADKLLDIAKNSRMLMQEEASQITESVARNLQVANYKENQTLSGLMDKVGTSLRGAIASPFANLGNRMSTGLGEIGDEYAMSIGRSRGVGKLFTAVSGIPRMGGRAIQQMFGYGTTGLGAKFSHHTTEDFARALALGEEEDIIGSGADLNAGTSGGVGRLLEDVQSQGVGIGSGAILAGSGAMNYMGRSGAMAQGLITAGGKLGGVGGAVSVRNMLGGKGSKLLQQGAARTFSSGLMGGGKSALRAGGRGFMKGALRGGAGMVARGAAKFAAGAALRVLSGPVGLALTVAELGKVGYDMYQASENEDRVRAWATAAGVNEDEAIKKFAQGDESAMRWIQAANSNISDKLKAGGYVPGKNAKMDPEYEKVYSSLVATGRLSKMMDDGADQFELLDTIKQEMKDNNISLGEGGSKVTDFASALTRGFDAKGKTSSIRTEMGSRLRRALSGSEEYTAKSKVELEEIQTKVSDFFDDEFKSETGKQIFTGGSAKQKQAVSAILSNPQIQADLLNADNLDTFRRTYKQFSALSDEELMDLKKDLKSDLESDESFFDTDSYAQQNTDRMSELAGLTGNLDKMVKQANLKELQNKMGTARSVGSYLSTIDGGKELGELLESGGVKGLRGAGRASLDMVSAKGFDIKKIKDPRARNYLSRISGLQKSMGKFKSGMSEDDLRKKLKAQFKVGDEFIDKFLDKDNIVSDDELSKLTEAMATEVGASTLLQGESTSSDTLRQVGGKEGMTKAYLEAAKTAADANTAFVRAVYSSKTHEGIKAEVEKK